MPRTTSEPNSSISTTTGGRDVVDLTLLLAVLRGALLDLLGTGDIERTTAAVRRHVHVLARGGG
jgi:hypothetical protein